MQTDCIIDLMKGESRGSLGLHYQIYDYIVHLIGNSYRNKSDLMTTRLKWERFKMKLNVNKIGLHSLVYTRCFP